MALILILWRADVTALQVLLAAKRSSPHIDVKAHAQLSESSGDFRRLPSQISRGHCAHEEASKLIRFHMSSSFKKQDTVAIFIASSKLMR